MTVVSRYELLRAGVNEVAWDARESRCLYGRQDADWYIILNHMPGARKLRRLLRRMRQRDAANGKTI
jgi:hypothetical protein